MRGVAPGVGQIHLARDLLQGVIHVPMINLREEKLARRNHAANVHPPNVDWTQAMKLGRIRAKPAKAGTVKHASRGEILAVS